MSANTYYEAHITLICLPEEAEKVVVFLGWKFSKIDGDPTLGRGLKCYATKHFKASMDRLDVLASLHETADAIQRSCGGVVRRKIELVIYDDRSSTVRFVCNGACPECHLEDYGTSQANFDKHCKS